MAAGIIAALMHPFRWLAERPRLSPPMCQNIPTVDFYFLNALRDLVREPDASLPAPGAPQISTAPSAAAHPPPHTAQANRRQPIERLGPHTFAAGDRLVIIRYLTPSEKSLITGRVWSSVDYVLDDLILEAAASRELPSSYRQKLARFAANELPAILALKPRLVAPSQDVLDQLPDLQGARLDPCLAQPCEPARALAHQQGTDANRRDVLRLCFLGTRSHTASLPLLAAVAEGLATLGRPAALTLFFGRHLPRALDAHPFIDNREPLAWPDFKQFVEAERFHIALCPLTPTPFNRGRSITKVLDTATVGAVGLYSNRAPFDACISDGVDGFLISDEPEDWVGTISALANDAPQRHAIARNGLALANQRGDPARLRAFWARRLGLDL